MLQILAGLLITGGCLGIGVSWRRNLAERLRLLYLLQQVLEIFYGEIRYGRATLPECCLRAGAQLEEPVKGCLEKTCQILRRKNGISFYEGMSDAFAVLAKEYPLQKSDLQLFLSFVPRQPFAEEAMQLQAMAHTLEKIEKCILRAETELEKKGKLAMSVGVFSGTFLLLLFL